VWLNRLLDSMKTTVCHEMREAVVSYEEKPREVWVFEPPAQVALCAVQIWWTVETNVAFLRLEEGFENSLKDFNKKQVIARPSACLRVLCPRSAVKGEVVPWSVPSVGAGADPSVQALSPQVTLRHPPGGWLPLLTARPAVTFPVIGCYIAKLYCLMTVAHACQ